MSTGTKIMKSGSEPPTALELDVSQVKNKQKLIKKRIEAHLFILAID